MAEQFRGAGGAVGEEIVVAEEDDGVGLFQGIFYDPGFAGERAASGGARRKSAARKMTMKKSDETDE